MNIAATDISSTGIVLYLVLADNALRDSIQAGLPNEYNSSCYETVSGLFKAISNEQPAIILCHNDVLNENDVALSSIKMLTSARILLIGPTQTIDEQITVLKQGARGYFDSSSSIEKLYDALHSVLHGEVWVKRDVISELVDGLTKGPEVSTEQRALLGQLTPKEIDVAEQVSHGATNKMIARQMDITERTVKAHLTAIFQKLDVADRLSLAILFRDLR
ncbi:MAG: LuxR C-terminal-related transcriptional regulator [Methylophagaceae bacterium]